MRRCFSVFSSVNAPSWHVKWHASIICCKFCSLCSDLILRYQLVDWLKLWSCKVLLLITGELPPRVIAEDIPSPLDGDEGRALIAEATAYFIQAQIMVRYVTSLIWCVSRENRPFQGSKNWQFLGLQTCVKLVLIDKVHYIWYQNNQKFDSHPTKNFTGWCAWQYFYYDSSSITMSFTLKRSIFLWHLSYIPREKMKRISTHSVTVPHLCKVNMTFLSRLLPIYLLGSFCIPCKAIFSRYW